MNIKVAEVLALMELHMVMKAERLHELSDGYTAPEMRSPYASALLRNYHHYRSVGGTKTLQEILDEAAK